MDTTMHHDERVWTLALSVLSVALLGLVTTATGCVQKAEIGTRADTDGGRDGWIAEEERESDAGPDGGDAGGRSDGTTGCSPTTCTDQMCGTVPNGCGGTIDCGGCSGEFECGAGESPNRCAPVDAHCGNGMHDGDETATDCGGRCGACDAGRSCERDTDCKTETCQQGTCRASPRWESRAPMPTPRSYVTATFASDGRLYAIGGNFERDVEVYIPSENAWTSVSPLPRPRYGHAAVATGEGTIWVIGGVRPVSGDADNETTTDVLTYDIADDSWSEGPSMNMPRRFFDAAATDDGRIVAVGGLNNDLPVEENRKFEVYDPDTGSWTLKDLELNVPRNSHSVAVAGDGNVYAVGGRTERGITNSMEYHEPGTPGWVTVDSYMEHPREYMGLVPGPEGRLWAIGGFGGRDRQEMALVESFDPESDRWQTGPPLEHARWTHGTAVDSEGRIYVVGGRISDGPSSSKETGSLEVLVW